MSACNWCGNEVTGLGLYCCKACEVAAQKAGVDSNYNAGQFWGGAIGGVGKLAFKGAIGAGKLAFRGISGAIDLANQKMAEAQAEAERQAAIAAEVAKEQGRAAFEALKAKRTNRSTKAQAAEFLFCAECGTKLEAGSAFCDECGNRL